METLAACSSQSTTPKDPPHTFNRRIAAQLVLHAQDGDMTVDQYNSLLAHEDRHRPGQAWLANHSTSTENVRIANCGKGFIVLQPLSTRAEEKPAETARGLQRRVRSVFETLYERNGKIRADSNG